MPDDQIDGALAGADLGALMGDLRSQTKSLEISANGFARAMTQAFKSAVIGGKQFDDVLKSLVLRLSDLSLKAALKPIETGITSGINQLLSNLFGTSLTAATGAVKPFAAGGVIGTPSYFPLNGGGVGLAGEAGPEAILPLARGADGRLGVATAGGAAARHNQRPDRDTGRRILPPLGSLSDRPDRARGRARAARAVTRTDADLLKRLCKR